MKIIKREILFDKGNFSSSKEWKLIRRNVEEAIKNVVWPPNSKKFTIYPESGKKRGQGNGVVPIKLSFCNNLEKKGWQLETPLLIATSKPGPLDATLKLKHGKASTLFAVEWETGNISSSHRSLNKMALGIIKGILIGGILVLPTRNLYQYLTDRIGNFEELSPYFDLWKSIKSKEGILVVYAVEHDATSTKVPRIKKGTDGRAIV